MLLQLLFNWLPNLQLQLKQEVNYCIAIDVAQSVLSKTKPAFEIESVKLGSESLVSSDGRNRDVSTIDICIKRATA